MSFFDYLMRLILGYSSIIISLGILLSSNYRVTTERREIFQLACLAVSYTVDFFLFFDELSFLITSFIKIIYDFCFPSWIFVTENTLLQLFSPFHHLWFFVFFSYPLVAAYWRQVISFLLFVGNLTIATYNETKNWKGKNKKVVFLARMIWITEQSRKLLRYVFGVKELVEE